MQPLDTAERAGAAWAQSAAGATLADLRAMPADKVMASAQRQRGVSWPITDGRVIPDDQYKLYKARRYHDVPVLIRYKFDEGATFGVPASQSAYVQSVNERYASFAEKLLAVYPGGDTPAARKTARDLTRNTAFGWHTVTWARLQQKTGTSKVYLYYFDEHPAYGHHRTAAAGNLDLQLPCSGRRFVPDPSNINVMPRASGGRGALELRRSSWRRPAFYDARSVPHGEVRQVLYESKAMGVHRYMWIYTPPGYDRSTARTPVYYLLHGNGETQSGWVANGRANIILDNLIADGAAQPMIVVMPHGHPVQSASVGTIALVPPVR